MFGNFVITLIYDIISLLLWVHGEGCNDIACLFVIVLAIGLSVLQFIASDYPVSFDSLKIFLDKDWPHR